jgi:hypothetical protein
MMGRQLDAMIIPRVFLALSVALSGAAPVYAGIPAPQPVLNDAGLSSLLLKIQSVDPGDPDPNPPDPDPDTGGNTGGRDNNGPSGLGRPDRPVQNERLDTDRIVQDLQSIRRECRRYDEVYRIDCLRQGIDMTIARMANRPENREAKQILRRASRQLASIVSTYEDRSAPQIEVPRSANPRFKTRRTYRAVKRSALPKAMAKANAVVKEAATQLLRSAENSERRYAHYQQISVAVDSTKTLLRSG